MKCPFSTESTHKQVQIETGNLQTSDIDTLKTSKSQNRHFPQCLSFHKFLKKNRKQLYKDNFTNNHFHKQNKKSNSKKEVTMEMWLLQELWMHKNQVKWATAIPGWTSSQNSKKNCKAIMSFARKDQFQQKFQKAPCHQPAEPNFKEQQQNLQLCNSRKQSNCFPLTDKHILWNKRDQKSSLIIELSFILKSCYRSISSSFLKSSFNFYSFCMFYFSILFRVYKSRFSTLSYCYKDAIF